MSEYFDTFKKGITSVVGGLGITLKHLTAATQWRDQNVTIQDDTYFDKLNEGLVTIQYPSEAIPTPASFARYRLHNDANDCIACNQCANACPVNCITITSFKATPDDVEQIGTTSDGSKKKLWLPQFDIDMAKCMYCGLCTYPCPTECITMTPVHDFSEFDRNNFNYHFGNMTKETETMKREKLAKYETEEKAKKAAAPAAAKPAAAKPAAAKPAAAGAAEPAAAPAEKKMTPMMAKMAAAKKAAEGGGAEAKAESGTTAEAGTSEAGTSEAAKPAAAAPEKKMSPMMAAKLAAKKTAEGGGAVPEAKADVAPEASTEAKSEVSPEVKPEGDAAPAKKLPPMMAAKLAAKKAAEEAKKKEGE
jgi:NADH-quinone oxidoreductase subunit I